MRIHVYFFSFFPVPAFGLPHLNLTLTGHSIRGVQFIAGMDYHTSWSSDTACGGSLNFNTASPFSSPMVSGAPSVAS